MRNGASKLPICSAGLLPPMKKKMGTVHVLLLCHERHNAGEELLVNYLEFEEKSQVGWVEFGVGAIIQDLREKLRDATIYVQMNAIGCCDTTLPIQVP